MRIARYALPNRDPAFGVVELAADQGEFPQTVATLSGDPLAGPVQYTGERHPLEQVRLLAPVIPRSKIVAVGRNYAAHAAETGDQVPAVPLIFLKPNTSVIGPQDAIVRPVDCQELSWEGELAVVIGRICRKVPVQRAAEVIFGYTIANDVTARDLQRIDDQWARAKGADTFCPLGPWITTHLSPAEAAELSITTTVDQRVVQQGSTRDMIITIPELISHITAYMTLLPGDVILTGTPAGIGTMEPGARVSIEIDQLGTLSNVVVADEQEPTTAGSPA